MKKLILYDHQGNKLLEKDVFVEGQNFHWQSPKPMAFWLGEIMLVNVVESESDTTLKVETIVPEPITSEREEEKVESEKIHNQDTGNSRVSEASKLESLEGLPEKPARGEPSQRGKRARKRRAT